MVCNRKTGLANALLAPKEASNPSGRPLYKLYFFVAGTFDEYGTIPAPLHIPLSFVADRSGDDDRAGNIPAATGARRGSHQWLGYNLTSPTIGRIVYPAAGCVPSR